MYGLKNSRRHNATVIISFLFLSVFFFSPGIVKAENKTARITYYTGMEKLLRLEPVNSDLSYSMIFKGTTDLKTLVIEIARTGAPERSISIPLEKDGSFNYTILIKDGPGKYKVTVFGSSTPGSNRYSGVCQYEVSAAEKFPGTGQAYYLNRQVIDFVNSAIGRTVGRGECWDLAQEALDLNGADWARPFNFGMQLDPFKDEIRPGDIIQFRSVVITEKFPDGSTMWQHIGSPNHTAVVYSVINKGQYELAQQNSDNKRYVTKSKIDLTKITSGTYSIYRPVAILIKN